MAEMVAFPARPVRGMPLEQTCGMTLQRNRLVLARGFDFLHKRCRATLDRVKSHKRISLVFLDQGASSVANFILAMLVARSCSKRDFGDFVLTLAIARTIVSYSGATISYPLMAVYPAARSATKLWYTIAALLAVFFFSGMSLAGLGLASHFVVVPFPIWCGVLVLALSTRHLTRATTMARLDYRTLCFLGCSGSVTVILALYGLSSLDRLTATTSFVVISIAFLLPDISYFALLINRSTHSPTSIATLWGAWRRLWHVGRWILARAIVTSLSASLIAPALYYLQGPESAAAYGATLGLAGIINPVFMGLTSYLRSIAAHAAIDGTGNVKRMVRTALLAVAIIGATFLLGYAVLAKWLLRTVYGSNYENYGLLLICCVAATILAIAGGIVSTGLDSVGATREGFAGRLASAAIAILIGIPLIIWLAEIGAAIALLLANLIAFTHWGHSLLSLPTRIKTRPTTSA